MCGQKLLVFFFLSVINLLGFFFLYSSFMLGQGLLLRPDTGSVNRLEITHGYQEKCGVGFRVRRIQVRSYLWPSIPKRRVVSSDPQKPKSHYSTFRDQDPERSADSNFPNNLGSEDQSLGPG